MLRVNAEADNVLVMPLDVNATQMFAEIAGLGMEFSFRNLYILLLFHREPFSFTLKSSSCRHLHTDDCISSSFTF